MIPPVRQRGKIGRSWNPERRAEEEPGKKRGDQGERTSEFPPEVKSHWIGR